MKLRAIVVDDEDLARKNLVMLLEEYCSEIEVIGEAGNIDDAENIIESSSPDVVFLDIRMPSGSEGFDLLERIDKKDFFVIFVTAFKDYAVQAFNANAAYYILKPIDIDDLKQAVTKVVEMRSAFQVAPENFSTYFESIRNLSDNLVHNKPSNRIAISHTKGIKIIEDNTIVHLEASGNCTMLHFEDGSRYLDTRTLKIYEELLDPKKFVRVHKSHIINLNYLTEYLNDDGHYAILSGKHHIPVARNRVSDFVKMLKTI